MSNYFLLDNDYKDFNFHNKHNLKFRTVYGEQHTFIVLAVILAIFFPLVLFDLTTKVLLPDFIFLTFGATTQAVVAKTCQSPSTAFTYTFDGIDAWRNVQHYEGQDYATSSLLCPEVSDRIEIFYIQGHPQTSQKAGDSGAISIMIFGIIDAYGCYWLWKLLQEIRAIINARPKYDKLKRASMIVSGVINHAGKAPKATFAVRWSGNYIEVEYEFVADNRIFRHKQVKRRDDLRDNLLPPPGTPVRVLYAAADTYIML